MTLPLTDTDLPKSSDAEASEAVSFCFCSVGAHWHAARSAHAASVTATPMAPTMSVLGVSVLMVRPPLHLPRDSRASQGPQSPRQGIGNEPVLPVNAWTRGAALHTLATPAAACFHERAMRSEPLLLCLNVFSEAHLRRMLAEYFDY